ncbi:hypothetical protein LXL04_028101 [Taraxacum kok-saghyz]
MIQKRKFGMTWIAFASLIVNIYHLSRPTSYKEHNALADELLHLFIILVHGILSCFSFESKQPIVVGCIRSKPNLRGSLNIINPDFCEHIFTKACYGL